MHLTFPIKEIASYFRLLTHRKDSNPFAASGTTTHTTKSDPQTSTNWMLTPHPQETDLCGAKPDQPSLHNTTDKIQYFDSDPASP